MSDPQQIEKDLREYLEQEHNLRRDQRLTYLTAIFNKHLEISKLEHVMNYYDLYSVTSGAKDEYTAARVPMKISGKAVDSPETRCYDRIIYNLS